MEDLSSARCRLCFQKKFQLLPMFPANEPVNDELLHKIRECVSVSIAYEGDQNSMICIKCVVDVEQFYCFKEQCIQNDQLFHRTLQERRGVPMQEEEEEADDEEDEFDALVLPKLELMEEKPTSHHSNDPPPMPVALEAFVGPTKLIRIGYNYRVVRVADARNVLIFRKHRYCQPDEDSECSKTWTCIAKHVTDCPAKLVISSNVSFPQAICTRRIKHNHAETLVQCVGVIPSYGGETVKVLQKYTLAVDSQQRLRLLARGFRYRLRHALCPADGMSLWVCERSASEDRCLATVKLSYQDEKAFFEGEHSHNHAVEENVPVPTTVNASLMAQKKQKDVPNSTKGYNFKIAENGHMLFRGNWFKPGKANNSTSSSVWNCTQDSCLVKVRVRQKVATLINREHEHPPGVSSKRNPCARETLQQGVNYRLIVNEKGHIKLVHRKQTFTLNAVSKGGTSEWVCTWERMGCRAVLHMTTDQQVVYGGGGANDHYHRVGNVLEQYFPSSDDGAPHPAIDRQLWSCQEYQLLWNGHRKPIVRRAGDRFYAQKAFKNGTLKWSCTFGVRTFCDASITIDRHGKIVNESLTHDHDRLRKPARTGAIGALSTSKHPVSAIFDSPGPVKLLAGGFNYRRMVNVPLNVEIVAYCAHKYLVDDAQAKSYYCIMRDTSYACPGKIVLTNNALFAELTVAHSHSTRDIRRFAQPNRSSKVTVDGPNYKLIYYTTGRNCLLLHEGYSFRMYKLLEPNQCSRWRCTQGEAGCRAFLTVPFAAHEPATLCRHQHDHLPTVLNVDGIKQEPTTDGAMSTTVSQELCRVEVKVKEEPSSYDHVIMPTLNTLVAGLDGSATASRIPNHRVVPPVLTPCTRMLTVKREPSIDGSMNENDLCGGMMDFLNGHLYVRKLEAEDENVDMICAFHWTLNCVAGYWDLGVHNHDRFAAVRTNDRFNMLKMLISRGIIAQRGQMKLMQPVQSVSEYELLPSNGNLSLIIDNHRYYFYKAKNNGQWLWRCVRHRWQGCKIGVAVSHHFGKYYFQPYGTTEHEHS